MWAGTGALCNAVVWFNQPDSKRERVHQATANNKKSSNKMQEMAGQTPWRDCSMTPWSKTNVIKDIGEDVCEGGRVLVWGLRDLCHFIKQYFVTVWGLVRRVIGRKPSKHASITKLDFEVLPSLVCRLAACTCQVLYYDVLSSRWLYKITWSSRTWRPNCYQVGSNLVPS